MPPDRSLVISAANHRAAKAPAASLLKKSRKAAKSVERQGDGCGDIAKARRGEPAFQPQGASSRAPIAVAERIGSTPKHDDERGIFYGLVDDIEGLCEYESDTADGIEKAFRDAVDDYIDACRESETASGSSVL